MAETKSTTNQSCIESKRVHAVSERWELMLTLVCVNSSMIYRCQYVVYSLATIKWTPPETHTQLTLVLFFTKHTYVSKHTQAWREGLSQVRGKNQLTHYWVIIIIKCFWFGQKCHRLPFKMCPKYLLLNHATKMDGRSDRNYQPESY